MVWAEYSSAGDELVEEAADVFLNCFDFEEPLSDELKETIGIDLPEGKEREAIVSMRMNQEFFRNTLLANYNSRCCLTGLSNKTLLVATHIKPWKVSGPKTERLAVPSRFFRKLIEAASAPPCSSPPPSCSARPSPPASTCPGTSSCPIRAPRCTSASPSPASGPSCRPGRSLRLSSSA